MIEAKKERLGAGFSSSLLSEPHLVRLVDVCHITITMYYNLNLKRIQRSFIMECWLLSNLKVITEKRKLNERLRNSAEFGAVVALRKFHAEFLFFALIFISYYSFHCWPIPEIESHSIKVYCLAV